MPTTLVLQLVHTQVCNLNTLEVADLLPQHTVLVTNIVGTVAGEITASMEQMSSTTDTLEGGVHTLLSERQACTESKHLHSNIPHMSLSTIVPFKFKAAQGHTHTIVL